MLISPTFDAKERYFPKGLSACFLSFEEKLIFPWTNERTNEWMKELFGALSNLSSHLSETRLSVRLHYLISAKILIREMCYSVEHTLFYLAVKFYCSPIKCFKCKTFVAFKNVCNMAMKKWLIFIIRHISMPKLYLFSSFILNCVKYCVFKVTSAKNLMAIEHLKVEGRF